MKIVVKFGGDPIAKSPFTVGVAAPLDLSKVNVDNMDGSKKSVFLCASHPTVDWFGGSERQNTTVVVVKVDP